MTSGEREFPAITICNLSPYKRTGLSRDCGVDVKCHPMLDGLIQTYDYSVGKKRSELCDVSDVQGKRVRRKLHCQCVVKISFLKVVSVDVLYEHYNQVFLRFTCILLQFIIHSNCSKKATIALIVAQSQEIIIKKLFPLASSLKKSLLAGVEDG